jgi:5-methylcytosine-specific restriction protein A
MDIDPFLVPVTDDEIRAERRKARVLRNSQWWKSKTSKGLCGHCRGRFAPRELTMDHLVPIIRGGKSIKGNVVPSCKACNSGKQNKLPFD